MNKLGKTKIIIPQGYFEGRCEECVNSCRTGHDRGNPDKNNREMYCEVYKRKFFPYDVEEMNCSYYKMKLWCRIKKIIYIGIAIYMICVCIEIIALLLGIFK